MILKEINWLEKKSLRKRIYLFFAVLKSLKSDFMSRYFHVEGSKFIGDNSAELRSN